jgi:hypothetical protein
MSVPCRSHRCVSSWRKAAVHTQAASRFPALNLPRARAECSATKLDFAAGDDERALQARFLHKKSASGSYEKLPRSPQILCQR